MICILIIAACLPYEREIRSAGEFYFGVPAPVPIIAAQITQESNWKPDARSPVGAQGLLQFMPATAAWAAQAGGFGIAAPLDPAWSIRAGVWFNRWLYDRVRPWNTDCDRWLFTLSGYNGGEGWVRKRQAMSPDPGSWTKTSPINPGISASNQAENEQYSVRIIFGQARYAQQGPVVCKGGT